MDMRRILALALVTSLSACTAAKEAPKDTSGIPRTPDGKPNFTGVWAGPGFAHTGKPEDSAKVTLYDDKNMAPFTPEGKTRLYRAHTGNVRVDDPTAVCLPNGLTRQMQAPYAQQWIQTPDQIVMLYEYMHFFRVIPIGAPNRAHGEIPESTYMGDSIAWWDGDTLVIDTVGLKEWILDAFHPNDGGSRWHTDKMHVVERITFTDAVNATYDVTLEDPEIWQAPWTDHWKAELKPSWKIFEFVCDDNDRCRGGKCSASDAQDSSTE
jgi:hypothetical protein